MLQFGAQDSLTGEGSPAFDQLLRPIERVLFFEQVYERRPLLVTGRSASFYGDIVALEDVDLLLRSPATPARFLRVNRNGRDIARSEWSRGDAVDSNAVSELFASGATLIMNEANVFFRGLAAFCNRVEQEEHFAVQPNIYITPAASRAFDRHHDDHDVFIMQVFGEKNWKLYGSPLQLPSRYQESKTGAYAALAPEECFCLTPGDLLYIPRGHVHDAETESKASIHITFGLHPPYLFELVQELARRCRDLPGFRRAAPSLIARMGREDFAVKFKEQLHTFVDQVAVDQLVEAMDKSFVSGRNPGRETSFRDLLALSSLEETSRVAPNSSLVYRLDREAGEILLRLPRLQLMFPAFMEEPLRALLECDSLQVADIPGLLDRNGRIAIAKRLIEVGAHHIVAS